MRILINDKEIIFPTSLSEYTLGQRIAFQKEHGDLLDKMLESILEMKEETYRDLELLQFKVEKMYRTFAFFAGVTVEAIKESKFVDDVATIYHSCLAVLFEEEENLELKRSFIWKGEEWQISAPEINQGTKMMFGEFIDAKQIVKDLADMGNSKWEAMPRLAAIYLRKKDEPYKAEFVYEDSDRLELMHQLPMDIALQVGFFLSGTMNFSIHTLMSSESPESKEEENIPKNISTAMAG